MYPFKKSRKGRRINEAGGYRPSIASRYFIFYAPNGVPSALVKTPFSLKCNSWISERQ